MSPTAPVARIESPDIRLLPNYDELLIAFRDREDAMDRGLPPPARVAQVILAHIVVRDGLVVGGYRRREDRAATTISVDPLVELDSRSRAGIRAAADRFAAFLARPVEVTGLD
jgi:hypothetical protein